MVNSAQNQLGEWDVHSIRANDVISATLTRWTLTPYVRRHCGSGHLQIFSVQRFQSLWGFGDGLREHQLSKVPTRISDRQASKRPLSRIRQTSRTERKRRCIPTITNWFIGKLEPTYFEKVPLKTNSLHYPCVWSAKCSSGLPLPSPCTHNPLHYEGLCPSANLCSSVTSLPLDSILRAAFKKV